MQVDEGTARVTISPVNDQENQRLDRWRFCIPSGNKFCVEESQMFKTSSNLSQNISKSDTNCKFYHTNALEDISFPSVYRSIFPVEEKINRQGDSNIFMLNNLRS